MANLYPSPVLLRPQSFFAERFFVLFDSDGSGTITLQELQKALTLLIRCSGTSSNGPFPDCPQQSRFPTSLLCQGPLLISLRASHKI